MTIRNVTYAELLRSSWYVNAGSYEGWQCALWKNTLVTDSFSGGGDVAVFTRVARGEAWSSAQHVAASDGGGAEAVGLWEDDLVFCDPENDEVGSNAGAAYFFVRAGGVFGSEQKLTSPLVGTKRNFGNAVALGDSIAFITEDSGTGSWASSLHVARKSGGVWALDQRIDVVSGRIRNYGIYPEQMRICKSTFKRCIVGASIAFNRGEVYIYRDDGPGAVVLEANLLNPDDAADRFGLAVDIDDDIAVVYCANPKVFVFTRSGTTWSLAQKIDLPYSMGYNEFRKGIAVDKASGVFCVSTEQILAGDLFGTNGWAGFYRGTPGTYSLDGEYRGVGGILLGRSSVVYDGEFAVGTRYNGIVLNTDYIPVTPTPVDPPIAPQPYWPWAREVTEEHQGAGVIEHPLIVRHSMAMSAPDIRYYPLVKHGHWVRLAIHTHSTLPAGVRLKVYAMLGGYDTQNTLEDEEEPEA